MDSRHLQLLERMAFVSGGYDAQDVITTPTRTLCIRAYDAPCIDISEANVWVCNLGHLFPFPKSRTQCG